MKIGEVEVKPGVHYLCWNDTFKCVTTAVYDNDGGGWIDLERMGDLADITVIYCEAPGSN